MTERVHTLTVEVTDPIRLDKYLARQIPEYSRTRYQELIRAGLVTLDGEAVKKPGFLVEDGVEISVEIPEIQKAQILAENIPLEILFQNQDVIVVNKPAGMVVHPSPGYISGTLVNAVLFHAPEMKGVGGVHRPGLVHRLDKDTTGVIILAKNDKAHRHLQDQFRARTVRKTYIALVDGKPPTPEGRIETAIDRDNRNRKRMAVVPEKRGRAAVTEYTTIDEFPQHTLLHAHPLTGRTHQIRSTNSAGEMSSAAAALNNRAPSKWSANPCSSAISPTCLQYSGGRAAPLQRL